MRDAFSNTLVKLAQADKNLLLLTGDHGYALFDEFRKKCPDQYINAGIAEQNMVGMAAGLARIGFRPFVYGLSAFIPIRTVEQIKLDIAHDNLPVVLLGDGAGLVYSHLGTSHQSTEDIACTRAIPGLQVLSPSDRFEMSACMEYAYSENCPVYIRMGKADRGDIHISSNFSLKHGSLLPIYKGDQKKPGLIATGSMVSTALILGKEYNLSVWSAPLIKPISIDSVCSAASECNGLVTLEEHSVLGGLGATITEITSHYYPIKVLRIGVEDRFSEHCGTHEYLLKEHKIDLKSVREKILQYYPNITSSK